MLKRRIMPTLLLKNGQLVKGRRFAKDRLVGAVLPSIRVYEQRGVDELVLLDVNATPQGAPIDLKTIEAVAKDCFMPLSVGGGIRTLEDIRALLTAGADKVVIGTKALQAPEFVQEAARKFGSQCVVVAIDVAQRGCVSHCGAVMHDISPLAHAKNMEAKGAGEILLCSVERDGTLEGYDLPLIASVARGVNIPVIASGGAASEDDFVAAFEAGADAAAASAIFQFTGLTPYRVKERLKEAGVPVRI